MARTRVLHVITRFIIGGAQENTLLSVIGLRRLPDWQVFLATGPAEGPEGSLLERARSEGLEPIILRHMRREIHPARDIAAYRELERLMRRLKPEIVHTHSSKAGILGRLAAYHCGVPVIIHTIHGPSFHPHEKRWRNGLFVFLERWAARRSDALVSVADAMSHQYLESGIGRPQQYVTIRSGIETEPFLKPAIPKREMRRRLGLPDDAVVFAKVARLAPLKGHQDVILAAVPVKRAHHNARLLFIGDGVLSGELKKLAAQHGLDGCIVFAGLVPPSEIPGLLNSADALVHASYREGLPRAVVQAGLAGIPAISYAVDGTPEAIQNGKTGYLVAPGDIQTLSERMLKICTHPQEARTMGLAARMTLSSEFDWQLMVRKLDTLYANLLKQKGLWKQHFDNTTAVL